MSGKEDVAYKLQCRWVPLMDSSTTQRNDIIHSRSTDDDTLSTYYIPIALMGFFASAIIVGISYLIWHYIKKRKASRTRFSRATVISGGVFHMEGVQLVDYPLPLHTIDRLRQDRNDNIESTPREDATIEAPPPKYDEIFLKPVDASPNSNGV